MRLTFRNLLRMQAAVALVMALTACDQVDAAESTRGAAGSRAIGVSVEPLTTVTQNNTDVTLSGAPKALAMAACYAMQWSGISAYNCTGDSNSGTCNKLFGAGSGPDHITVDQCVTSGGVAPVPTPPGGFTTLTHRCHTPNGSVERGLSGGTVTFIYNRGASNRMTCRPGSTTLWFNYP